MKVARILLLGCLLPLGQQLAAQTMPPNIVADSAHAPFLYGVGSFDPTADHVILWTKVDPGPSSAPITLSWEVYGDAALTDTIASGTAVADQPTDWTARFDVPLPHAGTHYWYQWRDAQGHASVVGRTKTAAMGQVNQVRLAVMSCSSIFSGYFNAYRRVGERNDIDLVVHLGDYIYDFVDADERVRVPVPEPVDPQPLAEWRERHAYYLLDPDLRLARQMHPWAVIWDNHDTDGDSPQHEADAKQAMLEYVPMRLQNASRPDLIYRRLSYGDLLDLIFVDVTTLRNRDTLANGDWSILGDSQWTWLSQELNGSTARWRAIAQERMFTQFSTAGLGSLISYGDGPVADSGAWDGFNGDRVRLLSLLDQSGIDNNIVLSGDIHTSFLCDAPIDYNTYDAQTGAGSVAMEFLPASITRGNFDEQGITGFLAQLVQGAITLANPHHIYSELTSHGYGILDIRPDTATAEFWYSPILQVSGSEDFAAGYRALNGENHWQRAAISSPTVAISPPQSGAAFSVSAVAWPNPVTDICRLALTSAKSGLLQAELVDMATGRTLETRKMALQAGIQQVAEWSLASRAAGSYGLRLTMAGQQQCILLQHLRP